MLGAGRDTVHSTAAPPRASPLPAPLPASWPHCQPQERGIMASWPHGIMSSQPHGIMASWHPHVAPSPTGMGSSLSTPDPNLNPDLNPDPKPDPKPIGWAPSVLMCNPSLAHDECNQLLPSSAPMMMASRSTPPPSACFAPRSPHLPAMCRTTPEIASRGASCSHSRSLEATTIGALGPPRIGSRTKAPLY